MSISEGMRAQAAGLERIIHDLYEKGNSMAYFTFLIGDGPCAVKANPNADHNIIMVVDAIHLYQQENPEKKVKEGYHEGLMKLAIYSTDYYTVEILVSCLAYELKKEKEGSAAFSLDTAPILEMLRASTKAHRKEITASFRGFDDWLAKQNEYLETNFGVSLLPL